MKQEEIVNKPTFTVPMNGYIATLVNGAWQYEVDKIEKANQPKPIAKYKDPAQFKIVEKYEGIAKSRFQNQLGEMVMEVVKFLGSV